MHDFARIHSHGLHRSSVGDVMQTPLMANAAHSPADTQRNEHRLGGAAHHVVRGRPPLRRARPRFRSPSRTTLQRFARTERFPAARIVDSAR